MATRRATVAGGGSSRPRPPRDSPPLNGRVGHTWLAASHASAAVAATSTAARRQPCRQGRARRPVAAEATASRPHTPLLPAGGERDSVPPPLAAAQARRQSRGAREWQALREPPRRRGGLAAPPGWRRRPVGTAEGVIPFLGGSLECRMDHPPAAPRRRAVGSGDRGSGGGGGGGFSGCCVGGCGSASGGAAVGQACGRQGRSRGCQAPGSGASPTNIGGDRRPPPVPT